MANEARAMDDYLDEMAMKILMIEPGDLSVVGELLELTERLMEAAGEPRLGGMAGAFRQVLERIVMGEAADSAENYDRLAQCIVQMQEITRKEESGDKPLQLFCEQLTAIGFPLAPEEITALGAADPVGPAAPAAAPPAPAAAPAAGGAAMPDFLQDQDLISGFVAESFEHLESIEVNVLDLENNPGDRDIINNIFRTFHTIKGVSGFLNLKVINELAHTTENLLDDVRNDKMGMNSAVIDIVLSVGDFMRSMVQNIKDVLEQGPEQFIEYDITSYVERIRVVQAGGGETDEAPPAEEPAAPEAPPGEETAAVAAPSPPPPEPVPVTPPPAKADVEPAPSPPAPGNGKAESKGPVRKGRVGDAIKVDVEKLDSLVNAVGELVIMQTMVRQNPRVAAIVDPKLNRDFSQLSRITTEVQRTAMSMRMVPIRQTFQKMIRLVRDLSRKSGKQVDLVMSGEETEIDRNMVDSIYDPLVHMIRNSVDHGVQPPAEREQDGKPPTGTVHLRAYQKGGNIVIEIEDDGRGLNTGKIHKKALERGLIKPDENLTDHEINNLIFFPGFSTADQITDVSGRGVGMDVVKKSVEKLRGKVEVQNQPGKGSLFLLRLPLTLAIIDGIIVRVGSERYIIPTTAIQESLRPAESQYSTVHGKGEALTIRNRLIPIIRLYDVFGVETDQTDPLEAIMVVVENEGRQRALMVDELLGKQEVVIKSLGGYLQDTQGVAGGTILGDGRVGLILDLAGLIGTATTDGRTPTGGEEAEPAAEEMF